MYDLGDLEGRIEELEQRVNRLESLYDGFLNWFLWVLLGFAVSYLWGDKIWEVMKMLGAFVLLGIRKILGWS